MTALSYWVNDPKFLGCTSDIPEKELIEQVEEGQKLYTDLTTSNPSYIAQLPAPSLFPCCRLAWAELEYRSWMKVQSVILGEREYATWSAQP